MTENKYFLINDLKNLGMINVIMPDQKSYDYALFMGGLKERVLLRLNWLVNLEKQDYIFEEKVLFGSARLLRPDEKDGLPHTVITEAQTMEYVYNNHPELQGKNPIVIDVPMIKNKDGGIERPKTEDTLIDFSKVAKAGSGLVIPNNPYVSRQTKVVYQVLFLAHWIFNSRYRR